MNFPDRVFQLWSYTVGGGRLLFRSPKSERLRTRVDIAFQNVHALNVPAVLEGLVVAEADRNFTERIIEQTGLLPDGDLTFFALSGVAFNGFVVASGAVNCEDTGEYYEASEVWKPGPGQLG